MSEGDNVIEHILRASVERGCIITIIYQSSIGISERNIKVLEILQDRIKAYCYLRRQVRYFKPENILSAAYYYGRYKAIS